MSNVLRPTEIHAADRAWHEVISLACSHVWKAVESEDS